MSALTALVVALMLAGPDLIRKLAAVKAGQVIRSDGPQSHLSKAGTPTMGGALIILAVDCRHVVDGPICTTATLWITLGVLVAFGIIGFYDDYKKTRAEDQPRVCPRAGNISGSRCAGSPPRSHFLRDERERRSVGDRAVCAAVQADRDSARRDLRAARLFHHRRIFERGESHRRSRWTRHHADRARRIRARRVRVSRGQQHLSRRIYRFPPCPARAS